jgi:Peptidase family M1 domain
LSQTFIFRIYKLFLTKIPQLTKPLLALFSLLLCTRSWSQTYWQQQVNYTIAVSLDDKANTLDGFEKIEYTNHSPDTLRFIWFHLWPNAYKNDKTAFSDQMLEKGDTRFYFSSREEKGYINRLDFKVDNITAETQDHPQHIDIVKVVLPSPLAPGAKTIITTPFHVKLPFNFSRGGHEEQSYQATQWYPKPAVYDKLGWHEMPYLDHGEFYSEFGSYDVSITVPENYVVAATGELQNAEEKEWLNKRAHYTWEPIKKKEKKNGAFHIVTQLYPVSSVDIKTLRYRQDNVHDFAWFADKRFIVDHDTCRLPSGRIVDVYSYYTPAQKEYWANSIAFARQTLQTRSAWIGEYPYSVVSVVQGPESFGGGMEYPTITIISPEKNERLLEYTIEHEIGHNWFYGALGSNERRYAWMDEGLNSYYDNLYQHEKYGAKGEIPIGRQNISVENAERLLFQTQAVQKNDQPIGIASDSLTSVNYGLVSYYKTAAWLEHLQSLLGREAFDKGMREYYRQWQFKHPAPNDFQSSMEHAAGRSLDTVFQLLNEKGVLPGQQRSKGIRPVFAFGVKGLTDYVRNPSKQLLLIGPAIGINSYDRFMIGAFATNYQLPPSRLRFFAAPLYAPATKKLTGTGLVNYAIYPARHFHKVELGVSASTFTIDKFTDPDGVKVYSSFYKIVPSLKLVLNERDPRSTLKKYIQFKTFLINEDVLHFYRDTVIGGANDTTISDKYRVQGENRTLNQLKFVIENSRALYPYRGELNIEQGKDFLRTAFTGNYFFNYGVKGGLDLRFFAGKFFYTSSRTFAKQFSTDRYHLNMTGPNGYEDYTYSDYFVGRNEFEGTASQQIMIRDGGFKVRTELLADKVGRTDNWLIAVNLASSIPNSVNPLSLLPVKIPLKIFADIGTYAEAWDRNASTDRFLFDAGLQIPLFRETVNIYVPLLYSKVYKDYIQQIVEKKNRLFRTISFSINISGFNLQKFNRSIVTL